MNNVTSKRNKSKENYYNTLLNFKTLITLMILVVSIVIVAFSTKTNAKEYNQTREKYYTSIKITSGDTLWSIAEENRPATVSTTKYIKDLKIMNNLTSDTIHEGNYLTIYYFKE